MTAIISAKTSPPKWLLAMCNGTNDKTFGKVPVCSAENAVCNLGAADWHGREAIRQNLRTVIDTDFTAEHDVVEYWDSRLLKIVHDKEAMKFEDPGLARVRPAMTRLFYMDEADPSKVIQWIGAGGPTGI